MCRVFFVGSLNLDEILPEPETEPDDGTILADDFFEKGGRDHRTENMRENVGIHNFWTQIAKACSR